MQMQYQNKKMSKYNKEHISQQLPLAPCIIGLWREKIEGLKYYNTKFNKAINISEKAK